LTLVVVVVLICSTSIRSVLAETTGTCSADDETCTTPDTEVCEDRDEECQFWAEEHNECEKNPVCEFRFDLNRCLGQATKHESSTSISYRIIPFVATQICTSIACEVVVCAQIKCTYRRKKFTFPFGMPTPHLVFFGRVFCLFFRQWHGTSIGRR